MIVSLSSQGPTSYYTNKYLYKCITLRVTKEIPSSKPLIKNQLYFDFFQLLMQSIMGESIWNIIVYTVKSLGTNSFNYVSLFINYKEVDVAIDWSEIILQ